MTRQLTELADFIHGMKYREQGEDFREAMNRVAFGLRDSDGHYKALREILIDQRFCPGGRIQAAVGALRATTPYNCYVSGTLADSFVDGLGSIMDRAKEAAATMRMGGGIGYDFSTLRPRGAEIKKLRSHSSGPVSFMRIFNEVCLATASSGHRRGAQMGILRVDHPDIDEFVRAKQNTDHLNGFNISVAVTDEFMEAVELEKLFPLRFGGETVRRVDAAELWEKIMRSTWDWGEPGVVFIDTINKMNNLWYCETIAATNPCGEQPLPPFGACLLGSFNLTRYLSATATAGGYGFNWGQLKDDIPVVVRAMDNVIDRARYPLAEQRAEAITKRRMGLGVMGLANALEAMGHSYGTPGFISLMNDILQTIRDVAYLTSVELAREKGAFSLCDPARYADGRFIQTLDPQLRQDIAAHGIRNSHLTSIAPTGTISLAADNVSSGIEPVFAYSQQRPVNTPEGPAIMKAEDYGVKFLGVKGRRAAEVTAREHLAVLKNAQRYVDSAVSKTINMDSSMPWADFKDLYLNAWVGGAKGCATFNIDGKRMALLTDNASCQIDPETGERSCD